jgi:hypothetical protein
MIPTKPRNTPDEGLVAISIVGLYLLGGFFVAVRAKHEMDREPWPLSPQNIALDVYFDRFGDAWWQVTESRGRYVCSVRRPGKAAGFQHGRRLCCL